MRKSIVIIVAFALLGSGYWLVSTWIAGERIATSPETSTARIAPTPSANALEPPAASDPVATLDVVETAPVLELDEDGDSHAEVPDELQPLVEPPALSNDDPDPVVGEVAALQEARAMVQSLLAETDDPAAREEAEALLEIIDSRAQ